jgi:hypothetical protein
MNGMNYEDNTLNVYFCLQLVFEAPHTKGIQGYMLSIKCDTYLGNFLITKQKKTYINNKF